MLKKTISFILMICALFSVSVSANAVGTDETHHKWQFLQVMKEPLCNEEGLELWRCEDCGKYKLETIWGPPHNFTVEKIPVTAYTVGYDKYTCTNCHLVLYENGKAPTGHVTGIKVSARTAYAQCLTWNKVKTAGGYQVQSSTADGKHWDVDNLYTIDNVNRCAVKNLNPMTLYKFRIRFYIKGNNYHRYYSSWQVIQSPTLPATPKMTSIIAKKNAVKLNWRKQNNVTGYNIEVFKCSNTRVVPIHATVYGAKNATKTFTGLEPHTDYCYSVRAFKKIGNTYYFSNWVWGGFKTK